MLKKILTSSIWLLIGNSIGRLAMFLASIFAARLLSQEAFGQFSMIRSTISSIEGLISGTLGATTVKKVAENQDNRNTSSRIIPIIFLINLSFLMLILILFYFNINYIVANFFLNNTSLIQSLYLGIFILTTTALSNLIQNILMGYEEFKLISKLSMISSFISIPIIYLFTSYLGLNGALVSVGLYFLFDFILKFIFLKRVLSKFTFNFKYYVKESKELLIFVFPIFLTFLINGYSFWYARIMVIEKTNGFNEIAIFDAAFQWLTIIMIITGATTNVVLPKLSNTLTTVKDSKRLFWIGLFLNIAISIFISLIFIFFSKSIMSIYGENYIIGYKIVEILCYVSIAFTISLFLNRYNISKDKSWILFFASLFGSIGMFSLIYLNINILNITILAWSFFVYYCMTIFIYILKN